MTPANRIEAHALRTQVLRLLDEWHGVGEFAFGRTRPIHVVWQELHQAAEKLTAKKRETKP